MVGGVDNDPRKQEPRLKHCGKFRLGPVTIMELLKTEKERFSLHLGSLAG